VGDDFGRIEIFRFFFPMTKRNIISFRANWNHWTSFFYSHPNFLYWIFAKICFFIIWWVSSHLEFRKISKAAISHFVICHNGVKLSNWIAVGNWFWLKAFSCWIEFIIFLLKISKFNLSSRCVTRFHFQKPKLFKFTKCIHSFSKINSCSLYYWILLVLLIHKNHFSHLLNQWPVCVFS
jgi:hypothetical protein